MVPRQPPYPSLPKPGFPFGPALILSFLKMETGDGAGLCVWAVFHRVKIQEFIDRTSFKRLGLSVFLGRGLPKALGFLVFLYLWLVLW